MSSLLLNPDSVSGSLTLRTLLNYASIEKKILHYTEIISYPIKLLQGKEGFSFWRKWTNLQTATKRVAIFVVFPMCWALRLTFYIPRLYVFNPQHRQYNIDTFYWGRKCFREVVQLAPKHTINKRWWCNFNTSLSKIKRNKDFRLYIISSLILSSISVFLKNGHILNTTRENSVRPS